MEKHNVKLTLFGKIVDKLFPAFWDKFLSAIEGQKEHEHREKVKRRTCLMQKYERRER